MPLQCFGAHRSLALSLTPHRLGATVSLPAWPNDSGGVGREDVRGVGRPLRPAQSSRRSLSVGAGASDGQARTANAFHRRNSGSAPVTDSALPLTDGTANVWHRVLTRRILMQTPTPICHDRLGTHATANKQHPNLTP